MKIENNEKNPLGYKHKLNCVRKGTKPLMGKCSQEEAG